MGAIGQNDPDPPDGLAGPAAGALENHFLQNAIARAGGFQDFGPMAREPESYFSPDLFQAGIGEVAVCRFKGDGRVEAGIFLVDLLCLGVKNALYAVFPSEDAFREEFLTDHLSDASTHSGARGRKFVEAAVAYAASLGISPHSDYKKGAKVFGGIDASSCSEEFVFGRAGRPVLLPGPDDKPERIERIRAVLRARVGEDGFDEVDMGFAENEEGSERLLVAMDTRSGGDKPSVELVEFAEKFLEEHPEYDDFVSASEEENLAVAEMIQSARAIQEDGIAEGMPDFSLEMAMQYLQTQWNLQVVDEEQRIEAFSRIPQPERGAMMEAFKDFSFPELEHRALLVHFQVLQANEPGNESLLVLMEPLDDE